MIVPSNVNVREINPNTVLYEIHSNRSVVFVSANVSIINGTVAEIDESIHPSLDANPVYENTCYVQLSSIQLRPQNLIAETQAKGINGTVLSHYKVVGNSYGLVSYFLISAEDEAVGINITYSVQLLVSGVDIQYELKDIPIDTGCYLFIPGLMGPVVSNSSVINYSNSSFENIGANHSTIKDPELKLYERDNTLTKFPVWHLFTSLSVTAFGAEQNCYTDSITAQADSYLLNWHLESDNLKTVSIAKSLYSEVIAYGTAHFCGVFAYPPNFLFWNAYPNVSVCEFNSQQLKIFTESGFFHDPIQASTATFSYTCCFTDISQTVACLPGCQQFIEYIVKV
jgi:hypothetical protein